MFLTRVLNATVVKSKYVLVEVESVVSGHKFETIRLRKDEKREMICFDPLIRQSVPYVETKKVKGVNKCTYYKAPYNIDIERVKPADPFDK